MANEFTIRLDDTAILARLSEIAKRVDDMTPAMRGIGEVLVESTKQRFETSTGPDGQAWKPNALATILGRLAQIGGAYSAKTGRMTKKGAAAFTGKKPLIATGVLQDTIRYQIVAGGHGVEIGTNRFASEWEGGAAVHQFGSKTGKIPARPFLGISDGDRVEVLDILDKFLQQAIAGA